MEISSEQFQEIIARRLLTQAVGVDVKPVKDNPKPQVNTRLETVVAATPAAPSDFITVEKNLASLGYFTPSSKKIPGVKKKIISFTKTIDGKKVEVKAVILPSAEYGLPNTADQDKWFALQKIIAELFQHEGEPTNPIGFTSAELLRELGKRITAGKNYEDIGEWLQRMTLTGIRSEGVVYFAGRKVWATDTFHVVDRSINFGSELPDGTIADRNYIWLSEWQLENLKNNYFLPVDFETYKQLRNHIAKALVPLLQIWLYATRDEGIFEKRYEELCQILNIRQYPQISRIEEQLGPSLDELKTRAYIADWKVEKTSDRKAYKIVFHHGDKFYRDRNQRLGKKQKSQPRQIASAPTVSPKQGSEQSVADHPMVSELIKRGATLAGARKLTQKVADDQPVLDQLEWGDHLIAERTRSGDGIKNPPGFYIYLVQNNVSVPENFVTSRKRRIYEEKRAQADAAHTQKLILEDAYEAYRNQEIDTAAAEMGSDEFRRISEEKKATFLQQFKSAATWEAEALEKVIVSAARSEVAKRVVVLTFEAFCERERQRSAQTQLAESPTEQGSDPQPTATDDQDDSYLNV